MTSLALGLITAESGIVINALLFAWQLLAANALGIIKQYAANKLAASTGLLAEYLTNDEIEAGKRTPVMPQYKLKRCNSN
jgi:hypothetical protein